MATKTKVKTDSLHERAIDSLLERDARIKRRGFWADARALWDELLVVSDAEEHDAGVEFPKLGFLPDAHLIDRDRRKLVLFEVEDRNPLSRNKRALLGDFWEYWEWMDFEGEWLPEFHMVNRFGAITHQLHGSDLFIEGVMQDAHDSKQRERNRPLPLLLKDRSL